MTLLFNEQLDYWIHWYLDKANVRVRLRAGKQKRTYSARELPSLWNSRWATNAVWRKLKKAAFSKVRNTTVEVVISAKHRLDAREELPPELAGVVETLRLEVENRSNRFVREHGGDGEDDEPSREAPDAAAWGRELVASHPVSLRALWRHRAGREELARRALLRARSDEMGNPLPEVLGEAGREAFLEGIDAAVATSRRTEGEAFVARFPGHPLLLTDWAIARWSSRSERALVKSWLTFLAQLQLPHALWTQLGTDASSLEVFRRSKAAIARASKYPAELAGALDDADYRHELSGSQLDVDPDTYEGDWDAIPRTSQLSKVFARMLKVCGTKEFAAPGLRAIERRALLAMSPEKEEGELEQVMALLTSPWWRSLPPDDIERWLKLKGYAFLHVRPDEHDAPYLAGERVIEFWLRVAASKRSPARKHKLFETALDARVEYNPTNKLLARFYKEAQAELEGLPLEQ